MPKGETRTDLVKGTKIESLTLQKREARKNLKTTRVFWKCKCVCGQIVYRRQDFLTSGKAKSCGCQHPNYSCHGTEHANWKGHGEISGEYFCLIKKGAQKRQIEFSISIDEAWNLFQKQEGKCVLTQLPLVFTISYKKHRKIEQTASLDRIDSSRGYTIDNVQWLHKDVQRMKNHYPQDYFIKICKLVALNNQ